MIINLPVTVEMSMPHVYANQIEYCDKHLKYRDSVIISTHPHNDRGSGVAGCRAGRSGSAQRVECCLFGNGERTGNVDAMTLAMNMYSHGVDPKLDFSDMPAICAAIRAGDTDAHLRAQPLRRPAWCSPPSPAATRTPSQRAWPTARSTAPPVGLPLYPDRPPRHRRTYDADVIRINSQSGKGGIGFLLQQNYGYNLPAKMREALGYKVKSGPTTATRS